MGRVYSQTTSLEYGGQKGNKVFKNGTDLGKRGLNI